MSYESLKLAERIGVGIDLGESHFREFKSALDRREAQPKPRNPKDLLRTIAEVLIAFANADGGELLLGVEDDGNVTGVPHKDEILKSMEISWKAYVHESTPLPTPTIRRLTFGNKELLYFAVPKGTAHVHVTSDGRCLQRFDKEIRPVPAERIQYERKEQRSREYDRFFVDGASLKDLDIDLLDSVATRIAQGYSPEKLLQFLNLAEFSHGVLKLRRSALLLFGKEIIKWHPRCEVRILRVAGTSFEVGEKYNVIQDDSIRGNLITILETAWEALRPHLARTRFETNAIFRESIIYPEVACREGLTNAVAHRDYASEGLATEILIFDDRMEIRSPGGLLSSVSIDDLKQLKRTHESRNVMIARVLKELGYMREMGEGIPRIFSTMRTSDLVDPEFHADADSFSVILRHKSIFSPKDIEWLNGYQEIELSRDEQRVVLLGRDAHLLATNEIIKLLNIVDTDDFRALCENMRLRGVMYNAQPKAHSRNRRNVGRYALRRKSNSTTTSYSVL
jgi:ATP-dependent DNA helicase RecG